MAKMIETAWRKVERRLVEQGIAEPQRRVMCQGFIGGAKVVAGNLGLALDGAADPDEFARVLADYLQELQEMEMKGIGAVMLPRVDGAEGDERNGRIVRP